MCLNEASELGLIRVPSKVRAPLCACGQHCWIFFSSRVRAGGWKAKWDTGWSTALSVVLKPVPGLKWICLLLPYSRCPHLPWDWKPGAAGSSFPSQLCPWFLKWFRTHCRHFISLQNEWMWEGVTPSLWTSGKSRCPLKTLTNYLAHIFGNIGQIYWDGRGAFTHINLVD